VRWAPLALVAALWLSPPPEGLDPSAWHLFALFAAAIFSVVIGALPILTASVLALAVAGSQRHARAGEGLLGLRERNDPADRGGPSSSRARW
jgi:DASS family divalent anion:Na+ symporter